MRYMCFGCEDLFADEVFMGGQAIHDLIEKALKGPLKYEVVSVLSIDHAVLPKW